MKRIEKTKKIVFMKAAWINNFCFNTVRASDSIFSLENTISPSPITYSNNMISSVTLVGKEVNILCSMK